MESLFRQVGIYSSLKQSYTPVDKESLLFYNEKTDGAILEEGINEAGSMSSFIAAGTAYASQGINTIPFYLYYSIFGVQRMYDLIWAAGDMMCKGFLLGGISGRTTLAGEGLQHQDGHSHHCYYAIPGLKSYDPAFAYELAVIIKDGLCRMYEKQENIFYYITMMNEFYEMPPMPEGAEDGIIKGLYRYKASSITGGETKVNLFGSGSIMNEVIKAQQILESEFHVAADIWSVTSYKELYADGIETDHWNLLHPDEQPRLSYVQNCFKDVKDSVFVAASDYVKAMPCSIAKWLPGRLIALGTDGFGRSDGRASLRDYFEVDARYIVLGVLQALAGQGKVAPAIPGKYLESVNINPEKVNPFEV
jgi:pyruvate dehydrogenase E1 component